MNKNEVRPLSPLTLGYVLAVSTCFLDLIVMSYVAKSLKVFDFDKEKEKKKKTFCLIYQRLRNQSIAKAWTI